MRKIYSITLLMIILILLLTSCNTNELMHDPTSDEWMLQTVQALQDDDKSRLKELWLPEVISSDEEALNLGIESVFSYYSGTMQSWEKISQNTQIHTSQEGQVKVVDCLYRIVTENKNFVIEIIRQEQSNGEFGIIGLQIVTEQEYVAQTVPTGYLKDWSEFTETQWALTIYSFCCYAFIIITLINCIRTKVKYKPLFIILVFVQISFGYTMMQGQFNVNFMINVFGLSSMLIYESGGIIFQLFLPIGAVLYWILRKRFKKENHLLREPITNENELNFTNGFQDGKKQK
ncbi:DUF5104 domain-containing protein [Christensenellaceae bacterium OttesenSCG-928-K19]|nr:DUF5104 domain-containing protein [Christensenellaceae bacterium OttesenSCG-928-K19]